MVDMNKLKDNKKELTVFEINTIVANLWKSPLINDSDNITRTNIERKLKSKRRKILKGYNV